MLDRKALKRISKDAWKESALVGIAPNWRRAYQDLSYAADRLDAMLARFQLEPKESAPDITDLPDTVAWNPGDLAVLVLDQDNYGKDPDAAAKAWLGRDFPETKFTPMPVTETAVYGRAFQRMYEYAEATGSSMVMEDEKDASVRVVFVRHSPLDTGFKVIGVPVMRKSQRGFIRVFRIENDCNVVRNLNEAPESWRRTLEEPESA